jgi:hypothetical protein
MRVAGPWQKVDAASKEASTPEFRVFSIVGGEDRAGRPTAFRDDGGLREADESEKDESKELHLRCE